MKWIVITPTDTSPSGKTQRWEVYSKASCSLLGSVYWWPRWRQYVFEPNGAARIIFEEDCLDDLSAFLKSATAERYQQSKSRSQP